MARITYVQPDGEAVEIDVPDGWSLMRGAVVHDVDGIIGECGGFCSCATCHCYVEPARLAGLEPPSEGEDAMLDCVAAERRPNSRLACQLIASPATDGLRLELPDTQG
ncbi:MAG: 2Fe-2S iron-sulfur cluster-binding protein [Pseudomonadota bacterium]|jgi:2Fe-2S ferredoxin|nr:2Fe-2S iron-sulfur cluster-binding protein [Pseudomonadota bacterium]